MDKNPLNLIRSSDKVRRTHKLIRSDIKRMTHTARRRGRPELAPEIPLVNEAPIAMRLALDEKERTQQYAAREGRSLGNLARRVYLKGLAQRLCGSRSSAACRR
ncbi:hypothetical protein [Variovorax atrisoli]|uniref:hypothetical protein n=1 Tax=Variovorax atrisoli TaxID=3394203 RepID=UPI0033923B53